MFSPSHSPIKQNTTRSSKRSSMQLVFGTPSPRPTPLLQKPETANDCSENFPSTSSSSSDTPAKVELSEKALKVASRPEVKDVSTDTSDLEQDMLEFTSSEYERFCHDVFEFRNSLLKQFSSKIDKATVRCLSNRDILNLQDICDWYQDIHKKKLTSLDSLNSLLELSKSSIKGIKLKNYTFRKIKKALESLINTIQNDRECLISRELTKYSSRSFFCIPKKADPDIAAIRKMDVSTLQLLSTFRKKINFKKIDKLIKKNELKINKLYKERNLSEKKDREKQDLISENNALAKVKAALLKDTDYIFETLCLHYSSNKQMKILERLDDTSLYALYEITFNFREGKTLKLTSGHIQEAILKLPPKDLCNHRQQTEMDYMIKIKNDVEKIEEILVNNDSSDNDLTELLPRTKKSQ